jgi:hypothetical protein
MAAIQFKRYRILALINGVGYTVDLVRDLKTAEDRYATGGHRAAALYKGADTLALTVELAGVDSLTVRGSRRELARRSLLGQRKTPGHPSGRASGRSRSRRRTPPPGRRAAGGPMTPDSLRPPRSSSRGSGVSGATEDPSWRSPTSWHARQDRCQQASARSRTPRTSGRSGLRRGRAVRWLPPRRPANGAHSAAANRRERGRLRALEGARGSRRAPWPERTRQRSRTPRGSQAAAPPPAAVCNPTRPPAISST